MKCNVEKCSRREDCAILDIIKKQPKDWRSCSYFRTQEEADKKEEKLSNEDKPKRKYKKKAKESK